MKSYFLAFSFALILSACSGTKNQSAAPTVTLPLIEDISSSPSPNGDEGIALQIGYLGLTFHSLDGNRYVQGSAFLPATTPLEVELNGKPLWVVGAPLGADTFWVVALEDGRLQAFLISNGIVTEVQITPSSLDPGEPPALAIINGQPVILNRTVTGGSSITHPILLSDSTHTAFIDTEGKLTVESQENTSTLSFNSLPDNRILSDGSNYLLLFSRPTTDYTHGVLGDGVEAGGMAWVQIEPELQVIKEIALPADQVFEGIMPIWADITGDGRPEIIVTQSSYGQGAHLVVYDQNLEKIAASSTIGQSFRWRHQIAVAPFNPDGSLELVDVLTPHIGGVVEFFEIKGAELIRVAQVEGYTSHVNGSRNLDMALVGDFDGDLLVELLLPSQDLSSLGAIQRTEDSAKVDWTLPLNGHLATNLSAVEFEDGSISLAAGTAEGSLYIWLP